ncbi:MAG TPA: right-handed parallel beta-helix repeat-containing protein, partial [Tepidisphaeraceae bacterium]|nr:right-handed parallel beta-helix repeat-containing protein [Tepidisphaeraceae bacterium]
QYKKLIIPIAAGIVLIGMIGAGLVGYRYLRHFFAQKPPTLPPTSRPSDDPSTGLATFTDLQAKINAAKNGDRIVLPPGKYTGGADFDGKSNITLEAQTIGSVVLEGAQVEGGEKITLRGLIVQKVHTPLQVGAVSTGPDWVMEDRVVQDNESVGVSCAGPRSILRRVKSLRNGYMGFGCGTPDGRPFPGPQLFDCESAFNNTGSDNPSWKLNESAMFRNGKWYINPSWEAGGGKFCCADGLLIERMKSHDNGGVGIWLDVYDLKATIKDCESYNNFGVDANWEGCGFAVEICAGPTVYENCYAHDNTGSSFAIWESRNVTIRNCIASGSGIEFRDIGGDRGRVGWFCRNDLIDSVRFYGPKAKVDYWENQTTGWRENYNIVEKNLQLGLKGAPEWKESPQ